MGLTTDPNDPCLKAGRKDEGQNTCYLVLSEEERAKGFVRPYRDSYVHRGREVGIKGGVIEELSHEDAARHGDPNKDRYVAFLRYPESESPLVGKALTREELASLGKIGDTVGNVKYVGGCGALTSMGRELSETYARDPKFYGATFCVGCNKHHPVNEFVWDKDGEELGS